MNQYPDFDQKLYDDLRRGKEYAFAAVFDRYHRLLYTIAYRFLKSEEEAEDAVQYLFMKLWEQRETFSFESGIRSLLFTILKNYILNELRHRNLVFEKLYEMAQQDDVEYHCVLCWWFRMAYSSSSEAIFIPSISMNGYFIPKKWRYSIRLLSATSAL